MKTYFTLFTVVFWTLFGPWVQSASGQCTQVTNIRTFITDNQCPVGTITYHVYYFSEGGSGDNSVCYGYAVSKRGDESGGFIRSEYFGPVNQRSEENQSFKDEMDITINCDEIVTLFIHGWNQSDCKGIMCEYPISQVIVLNPLPVELESFSVVEKAEGLLLEWITWNEINLKGFTIQHSMDGTNWENIGFVYSRGSSDEKTTYQFLDDHPMNGVHYYRLSQLELDGTTSFSYIVKGYYNAKKLWVYPTLASDILHVSVPHGMNMSLCTSTGVLVESWYIDPDDQIIQIDNLQNGLYFIYGEDGSVVRFYKF